MMNLCYINSVSGFQRTPLGNCLTGRHQSFRVEGEKLEAVSTLYHYSNHNVSQTRVFAGKLSDPIRVFSIAILNIMR